MNLCFHHCCSDLRLILQSILDDQFTELLKLQDESNPDFAVEVVSLFFQDAEKLINNTASVLLVFFFTEML